uniref:Small ribosomal subunit protein uS10c n=1 Tax=Schizocladia ischiensis TaxID=196139 RepID=A0A7S6ZPB5_9STRA|nr:ribosomal protein S10 [Schizocladia ischiensis]QOW07562.1 ribosomal protein S10 [Schizocladia ischiensis]
MFMKKQKIRIVLESFNYKLLTESSKTIRYKLLSEREALNFKGPIFLPTKKRIYCVLRSPHVNKDSREQFEIRRYKTILDVYCEQNSSKFYRKLLDMDFQPGVLGKILTRKIKIT